MNLNLVGNGNTFFKKEKGRPCQNDPHENGQKIAPRINAAPSKMQNKSAATPLPLALAVPIVPNTSRMNMKKQRAKPKRPKVERMNIKVSGSAKRILREN